MDTSVRVVGRFVADELDRLTKQDPTLVSFPRLQAHAEGQRSAYTMVAAALAGLAGLRTGDAFLGLIRADRRAELDREQDARLAGYLPVEDYLGPEE